MENRQIYNDTINFRFHTDYLYSANFCPHLCKKLADYLGLPPEANNNDIKKYFKTFDFHCVGIGQEALKGDVEYRHDFAPYYSEFLELKIEQIGPNGIYDKSANFFHFSHIVSPMRNMNTLEEIKAFPLMEIVPGSINEESVFELSKKIEELKKSGEVVLAWAGRLFEAAWPIRGYEEFLCDMITAPEICDYLLDKITERNMEVTMAVVKAGIDVLISGDDVGNQRTLTMSKPLWRKFIKSRWAEIYAAARRINPNIQIYYHSDGNIMDIVEELIEIGVTILNPLQPECMDITEAKRICEGKVVFCGTIGTQHLMSFGNHGDVKREVRKMKREIGYDGGLMIEPTHGLEPEVPVENVLAFMEAASG